MQFPVAAYVLPFDEVGQHREGGFQGMAQIAEGIAGADQGRAGLPQQGVDLLDQWRQLPGELTRQGFPLSGPHLRHLAAGEGHGLQGTVEPQVQRQQRGRQRQPPQADEQVQPATKFRYQWPVVTRHGDGEALAEALEHAGQQQQLLATGARGADEGPGALAAHRRQLAVPQGAGAPALFAHRYHEILPRQGTVELGVKPRRVEVGSALSLADRPQQALAGGGHPGFADPRLQPVEQQIGATGDGDAQQGQYHQDGEGQVALEGRPRNQGPRPRNT